MLLQTTSYIVPRDKRVEHARLLRRFRQTLLRLGCQNFDVYEQVGAHWNSNQATGRFVQIIQFRDRKHYLAHQTAEKSDPEAQKTIAAFCELINLPYQQENGLFAVGYYNSFLKMPAPEAPALPPENAAHEPVNAPDAASAPPENEPPVI
jgi:quinol monooxygenase YgiN